MKRLLLLVAFLASTNALAQIRNSDVYELPSMNGSNVRNEINIPAYGGYHALKCDFHIHTIFSDGQVWPDVRVKEAWQDGLDVIAITDHIEYRPHKDILKGDLNESYKIAKAAADQLGFVVVKGIEITRAKPFGHINALFITDAVAMETPNALDAVEAALKQQAFIMWNHPGWPDDKSTLYAEHDKLIKDGKIHGIEVFNEYEYYPVSFDWCNEFKLAYLCNSDVHSTINNTYGVGRNLRPMTIVFATERSESGVREAMFAGRTLALFNGTIAGPADVAKSFVLACLSARKTTDKRVEVTNVSDIEFCLKDGKNTIVFPVGKTVAFTIPAEPISYTVDNCLISSNEKLSITSTDLLNFE